MADTKPVILAIDDELEVLRAVQRDLRSKYADDYRILAASGGDEANSTLDELAVRGTPVALILSDQRMPGTSGVDVLRHSLDVAPEAKKALLTAYADTDAAISAINDVGLDHYIMKPWDPPDQKLYPILDDLLADWQAAHRPRFQGVRVVAPEWSKSGFELRTFLASNQIPYRSLVVGRDEDADKIVEATDATSSDFPLVALPDGDTMRNPTTAEVAARVGLTAHAQDTTYDVAIVGAGPAGLAAAVYGSSEGLRTVLIEASAPGGQAGQSSLIENYLGFPAGISGADLARRAASQATRFGAEIVVPAEVESVELRDPYKVLKLSDGSSVACKALVVASGVSYRKLETEGLEPLVGAGVYYGTSTYEAANHRDQPMYVVGGGNSAGQAALFLSRFSNDVHIIIRRGDLSETMSQYLIDNLAEHESITIRPRSQVAGVQGDTHLKSISLRNLDTEEVEDLEASALFIFIGQKAQTGWLSGIVELDDRGFVLTGKDLPPLKGWNADRDPLPLEASVPGIFVAGDVRHGSIRRVAGATGEGATSVRFIHQHLADL